MRPRSRISIACADAVSLAASHYALPWFGQAFSTLGTINRDGAGYELDVIRAKKPHAGGYVGVIG